MSPLSTRWIRSSFASLRSASAALERLAILGYSGHDVEIASQTDSSIDWIHAFYVRCPESIVAGFAMGSVFSLGMTFVLSDGYPSLLTGASLVVLGAIAGASLGAVVGAIWGVAETAWARRDRSETEDAGEVSIGVRCQATDSDRIADLLRQLGGTKVYS